MSEVSPFFPDRKPTDFVTDWQIATHLGKNRMTIKRWRAEGKLPDTIKILGVNHSCVGELRKAIEAMTQVDRKTNAAVHAFTERRKREAQERRNGK